MATKFANVKGIKFLENPTGEGQGGVALVTFDLLNTAYTGGTDVVQLGGGGTDQGVATSSTLAALIQNRRRDGKTVTLTGAGGAVGSGQQTVAGAATAQYAQGGAVASGNVTLNLFNAATGGAATSPTTASWDRAAGIAVTYVAV